MHETATLVLGIIGALLTWTASVISLIIWLTGKFRSLEKLIYRELQKHQEEDTRQFHDLGTKVQRLELRLFGFTVSPPAEIPPIPMVDEPDS